MPHFAALAFEEIAHRLGKTGMREEMHAVRQCRIEASQPFIFAARARLEACQSALDAMLDSRVVADVKVQELEILEASPVAAIQDAGFFEAKTSRHQLFALVGELEGDVALEVGAHQLEKLGREILAAP